MSDGQRDVLRPARPGKSENVESDKGLVTVLRLEDSPSFEFDLTRMCGPALLRAQMASAAVAWSASPSGGRRKASALSMLRSVSSFLRWIGQWNQENGDLEAAQVLNMSDVTPFHLQRYRGYLKANHAINTAYGYYSDLTVLLRLAQGVPNETRREARRRRGDAPIPVQLVRRYPKREFVEIRNAARRCLEGAHSRITAAYSLAQQHEDPCCPEPARAVALQEVLVHGTPQSTDGMLILGATATAVAQGGGKAAARRQLFLSPDEVFAAAVLVACHRGLNLSPIVTTCVPDVHEPGVFQLNLDKPRRGPIARFWPEIFVEPESVSEDDSDGLFARIVRWVMEATDPARAYLSAQGRPERQLLIYWSASSAAPRLGIPRYKTLKKAAWIPDGTTIDFRRLRRSIPGRGVAKEPTDHSPDTYLKYVRSDPDALIEQHEEAAHGVQKLLDHSKATLAMRVADDQDTSPRNDAVLANCSDPAHHPDTGTACTTAFFSFMDCLKCSNAVTVPRLLPRQMATLQVLEEIRDGTGEVWERRFAKHHNTLQALVGRHTPAERELAAHDAKKHIATILAALRHEVLK